jgi:pimeloyl-ACP methyl ester carboxylesterase
VTQVSVTTKTEYIESTIQIKNKKYQYYKLGQGSKSLVFLHGMGSKNLAGIYLLEELLDEYTIYFLDLPGHDNLPYYNISTAEGFAKYVIDFIEYNKLNKFALVGFSFGGIISLKVASLLLAQNNLDIPVVVWASPLFVKDKALTINADLALKLGEIIPPTTYKQLINNKLIYNIMKVFKLREVDVNALFEFDTSQIKEMIKIMNTRIPIKDGNALYIFGTMDPLVKPNVYKDLGVDPDYKVRIKNGGHFGTYKGRKEAVIKIREFLKNHL